MKKLKNEPKSGHDFCFTREKIEKKGQQAFTGTFYFQVEKRKHCVSGGFMRKINFDILFFEVYHNSETKGESDQNKDWCAM